VTIRVLIADDQEMVRTGLRMMLDAQPDIEVIAEATDGAEAVAMARAQRPDVCLLDIRMPGVDGIAATRQLAGPDRTDPFAVVVITTFDVDDYIHGALRAGAKGFLLKDATAALVVEAVRAAANGDALISPAITARFLDRLAAEPDPTHVPVQPTNPLTGKEEEVLIAVAGGSTNAEIAEELFVSISTVKSHVNSLLTKLGVRNRVELAIWAHQSGRLDP
jgi:DNA-binding NarL/FixJ family response regulator